MPIDMLWIKTGKWCDGATHTHTDKARKSKSTKKRLFAEQNCTYT